MSPSRKCQMLFFIPRIASRRWLRLGNWWKLKLNVLKTEINHASLFSGIGGDDLAAEWMNWNNVFHCELVESKRKWLQHRWPKSLSYADIIKTDFTVHHRKIDILTGGDPCQVSSKIGKRQGNKGALYLWPQFFRAVREIKPTVVVNENVDGTISNGILDQKITDLESIGLHLLAAHCYPCKFYWRIAPPGTGSGLLPTCLKDDWKGGSAAARKDNGKIRLDQLRHWWKIKTGLSVPAPSFLRVMMGFPVGWMRYKATEMQ